MVRSLPSDVADKITSFYQTHKDLSGKDWNPDQGQPRNCPAFDDKKHDLNTGGGFTEIDKICRQIFHCRVCEACNTLIRGDIAFQDQANEQVRRIDEGVPALGDDEFYGTIDD
ncbi:hypothetical protein HN748_04250 [Candidatus Peregrinibacteria bacterium]|jgi:hypothetical protein|nr:hypothetical protein [Candidatus Peregrinibacteria bacterium]MBT7483470.1 hypothetical protein [Candidatus Peregrinibacteria bacterium]MBT7703421.1 hypothetical protein [Candidatus Peregrinibacteria bacterium]